MVDDFPKPKQDFIVFLQNEVGFLVDVDVEVCVELPEFAVVCEGLLLPVFEFALDFGGLLLFLLDFDHERRDEAGQVLLLAQFDFVLVVHDPHDLQPFLFDVSQFVGCVFDLHF